MICDAETVFQVRQQQERIIKGVVTLATTTSPRSQHHHNHYNSILAMEEQNILFQHRRSDRVKNRIYVIKCVIDVSSLKRGDINSRGGTLRKF